MTCEECGIQLCDCAGDIATLKAALAEQTSALRMERHMLDTVRGQRDDAMAKVETLEAALAESDIRIAGVESERDHYRAGLAESERARAEVTAERDALKRGQWFGPWEDNHRADSSCRRGPGDDGGLSIYTSYRDERVFQWTNTDNRMVRADSLESAKAAFDAHWSAAGWYLAKSEEG